MKRALIIDDEQHVRDSIKILLEPYLEQIIVVGEAEDVNQATVLIESCEPDVVFLDIHLKNGTGFDVLDQSKNKNFTLIFITAYEQYALKAFQYSAINYLLKPIDIEDFKTTIEERVLHQSTQKENNELIEVLKQNIKQRDHLVLRTQEKYYIVKNEEIIRCEASQNYTTFVTVNQKILISKTLKEYQKLLPESIFIRPHQSHLVNINFVQGYDREGFLEMKNNDKVPVSSRKKEVILSRLFS